MKVGADLNARNKDCETPIFTTVDNDAIPLYIEHGADQTIRNNKGKTVMETAKEKRPLRKEALRNAIQSSSNEKAGEDSLSKNHFANHWALPILVYSWL